MRMMLGNSNMNPFNNFLNGNNPNNNLNNNDNNINNKLQELLGNLLNKNKNVTILRFIHIFIFRQTTWKIYLQNQAMKTNSKRTTH